MEGTRKNVGSEYKKVGKWGFVPKLGVTLLAALIILSLAGCKNSADGGVGSSGGGATPAAAADGMAGVGNKAFYKFYDVVDGEEKFVGSYTSSATIKTFSEIKENARIAGIEIIESKENGFIGWMEEGTGELVASDEQPFSANAKFVASYQTPDTSKPIEQKDLIGEESDTCAWYSKEKDAFLIFNENSPGAGGGDGVVLSGKGYVEADAMISDYNKLYNKMTDEFTTNGNSDAYKEMYSRYFSYWDGCEGYGFIVFWALSSDDCEWGSTDTIEGCYGDWTPFTYYLSANGKALIDAETGEVAYRRVTIND